MNNIFFNESFLLSISDDELAILFKKENIDKSNYKKLINYWHPDKQNTSDSNIFIRVRNAYKKVNHVNLQKLTFKNNTNNKEYEVTYKYKKAISIGNYYVGEKFILYEINKNCFDLYNNYLKTIENLKYHNISMEKEFSQYINKNQIFTENKNETNYILLNKESDEIILQDLINYYKLKNQIINPKHVAWIISSMLNNACFIKYNNLVYSSFLPENYLVNIKKHTGHLNFWFFTNILNEKIKFLSKQALDNIGSSILNQKITKSSIDLDLIKYSAMKMLGAHNSITLKQNKEIPVDLINWIISPSEEDVFNEYKNWQNKVLINSFGIRKFEKLDLPISDIYSFNIFKE